MNNALDDLIAKVESGTATPADFRCLEVPMQDMRYTQMPHSARMAYKGSLDAAKALHEAALPGWFWSKTASGRVRVFEDGGEWYDADPQETVARTYLLAILRAMKEQAND